MRAKHSAAADAPTSTAAGGQKTGTALAPSNYNRSAWKKQYCTELSAWASRSLADAAEALAQGDLTAANDLLGVARYALTLGVCHG
jgi:hypothetical protein